MTDVNAEYQIRTESDVVRVRQAARQAALSTGLSLVDQTKLVTAASELARNTLTYGGGGRVAMSTVSNNGRSGLRIVFEDNGPGIADVERAMLDGYTTGNGLGLGLGGSRRLVNEFAIESKPGVGTTVTIVKWS
jgi:serine/threonine-protein kinase RsbT